MKRMAGIVVLSVALAAVGVASAVLKPFAIRSTLEHKTVLPHRIAWIARPTLSASSIKEVDFLIDGRLAWVEHKPPYVYGDDGNWLVTSWLTPGAHRFAVRARTYGGRKATTTTTARVLTAPPAPAGLNDTHWTRRFTAAEAGDAPAGVWKLAIDPSGWKITDPNGEGAYIDVAYLAPGSVETRGGIWTKPHNPYQGNAWCEDTNQPVRFTWAVAGDSLTFALAGPSGCDGLGGFLSKTWRRAN